MFLNKTIFLLSIISKVLAAEFSVVSFGEECQVEVGGTPYPMTREEGVPLFKATVDGASTGANYKYICDGQEDFERTLEGDKTYNEMIGRSLTVFDMPEFGYPNAEPWTRSIGRTELFDPSYVPIVIIDADAQVFVDAKSTTFNSMTFILKENVFSFGSVRSYTKNTDEDKFQFKVDLPDGGIYNRDELKFRPSAYDPVFFRQILYGDIAHAIGNPAHESVAVRVYLSDGTGIGLYVLQEDCTTESFIRTAFFGNPDGSIKEYTPNVIYDCATGADFTANDGKYLGSFKNNTEDLKIELLAMTQKLEALDLNNVDAVKDFDDNDLDLDTLLRALALEYLTGHWDSYWGLTTNFVTYHPIGDEGNYKFYFIDQDFDQTWGGGMYEGLDPLNYPRKPYTQLIGINWKELNQNPDDTETRVLVDRFLGCDGQPNCTTKELFENHLKSIVQHIFNPVAMKRKTDGYKKRLYEEMQWDLSLPRLHTGTVQQYHFTMTDFELGIDTAQYEGSLFFWGILDWTTAICDTVCQQFGIEYDKVPLTPETAAKEEVKPIDPGTKLETGTTASNTGENLKLNLDDEPLDSSSISINNFHNIIIAILSISLSIYYLF